MWHINGVVKTLLQDIDGASILPGTDEAYDRVQMLL